LNVAKINVCSYNLQDQINLIHSNMFDALESCHKKYNVIVSNPPYVTKQAMEELPPEFKHEPSIGLDGGQDGLDFIRIIVSNAPKYLAEDGILVVETGKKRDIIEQTFSNIAFSWLSTELGDEDVFLLNHKSFFNKHRKLKSQN